MAEQALAVISKPREIRVVEDSGPLGFLFDTARFEHMQRIATAMASASLIPKHLRGEKNDLATATANCFLVVNQAVRWQMDPFAVAPETYEVGGKLAYQGKLIAAVVNARAGLEGRLNYTFTGEKDDREVTVSGTFRGEADARIVTLKVRDAKTNNGMWTKDPDQKLIYSGVVKWARRWCPEIVLGVLTDDDLERMAEERTAPPRPQRAAFAGPTIEHAEAAPEEVAAAEAEPDEFDAAAFEAGFLGLIDKAQTSADVQRIIHENLDDLRKLDEEPMQRLTQKANARATDLEPKPEAGKTTEGDRPKDIATDWYDRPAGYKGCAEALINALSGAETEEALGELLAVPERATRLRWLQDKAAKEYAAVASFIERHRALLAAK